MKKNATQMEKSATLYCQRIRHKSDVEDKQGDVEDQGEDDNKVVDNIHWCRADDLKLNFDVQENPFEGMTQMLINTEEAHEADPSNTGADTSNNENPKDVPPSQTQHGSEIHYHQILPPPALTAPMLQTPASLQRKGSMPSTLLLQNSKNNKTLCPSPVAIAAPTTKSTA
ncbi:hypothetical protein JB92DRAFT_2834944 [Gautieria morchelliformis]|nr:hypothetical protein JB92DRAFT_2834944 [Gautieria morchelliformis]